MSQYIRSAQPNGLFFFTQISHQRRPILCDEAVRQALRQAIVAARHRYPFDIIAWVSMPDHIHTIWQLPEKDSAFGQRWSIIKRLTTQALLPYHLPLQQLSASYRARQEKGIWQRRFYEHQIRDEEDFQRHMDYLHYNPVKHGLVQRVVDWPYSSFHRLVQQGIYPANWGGGKCEDDGEYGE